MSSRRVSFVVQHRRQEATLRGELIMLRHQLKPSRPGLILLGSFLLLSISSTRTTAQSPTQVSVVQAASPHYPPELIRPRAITGDVRVNVEIGPDGAVALARAIGGHPRLIVASETAARRWVFSSTDARAGLRTVQLSFTFRLVDYRTPDELGPIFKPPFAVEVRAGYPVVVTTESNLRRRRKSRRP
jgi:hypothetical protein